jgi:5-methylcytosine-specific restriction endonuclease McrA
VHHILPRHEGGTDNAENLITWCDDCHIQLDTHRAKLVSKK